MSMRIRRMASGARLSSTRPSALRRFSAAISAPARRSSARRPCRRSRTDEPPRLHPPPGPLVSARLWRMRSMTDAAAAMTPELDPGNPFLRDWETPFGAPPFEEIAPEHYLPAFDHALAAHRAEIEAIAGLTEEPSFDNTIAALELAGRELRRVSAVFFNLAGSDTNDALQAIEREIAPRLARHRSAIYMNEALYRRVAALFDRRDELGPDPEEARVLDRYHTHFVRAGAQLEPEAKARLATILERLATLGTQFRRTSW